MQVLQRSNVSCSLNKFGNVKKDNKNPQEAPERKSYKKSYLLRKHQETEADKEIKQFEEPRCPQYERDEENE